MAQPLTLPMLFSIVIDNESFSGQYNYHTVRNFSKLALKTFRRRKHWHIFTEENQGRTKGYWIKL